MADAKKLLGGLGKVGQRLLASDKELTAAERAEAGRKAAALIQAQQQVKPSEALGQLMEKGVKRTTTTQADRTRVGGGNIGGASFPAISEVDPAYTGRVWGVMDEGTAARLKNLTDPETAWTTMLGSANQLKTNPIVFDKLKRGFQASMKQGNLSDELAGKINHNLALTFGEGADIRDPKIWKQADTFEKRAALADVMMGQGIAPSKGGVAIGGEKSGKGVIFRPTDILKRETEPSLLHTEHGGDVPTFAAGPRLFRLEKESEFRPDLHPGFPTLIRGKDYGINMKPTPTEVYLPDWHARFKKNNPERKGPGYYDLALGVKGEGLPSQDLNDEYIRHLLREGFKDGGEVDIDAADARLTKAIEARMSGDGMAKGGEVDISAADARLEQAVAQRMAGGGKAEAVKGVAKGFKRLFADRDVLPLAEREANKAKFLDESKIKERVYHGTGADISEFKPSVVGAMGPGTYVTTKPKTASEYSNVVSHRRDKNDPNVLPLNVQVKNPFPITNVGRSGSEFFLHFDPTGKLSDAEVIELAKKAGYDAVHALQEGEINVFDPRRIKSDIGNRGTYDVNDPDITKAHGGLAMAGGGKAGALKGALNIGKRLLAEPAAESKIIQAPSVIIPSKLSNVKESVRQSKGDFGARRVERAADEIPNLEKLYKEEGLRSAFVGDNAQAVMTMKPGDFEKFAKRLEGRTSADIGPKMAELAKKGEIDKYTLPTDEYVQYLKRLREGFDDVPFLGIDKEEFGLPLKPFISGHEGRHRSRALAESGQPTSLVRLIPRAELREPFPRRSQEEYLDALRQELDLTGNLVLPEGGGSPIVLPDIYAEGGGVHMQSGGKAGAVKGALNIGKRLFAESDVLPTAQREANLKKFLERSQVTEPVFHAAKTDVKKFSPKHRTELSSMGHHFGTAEQANTRTRQYDFESEAPNVGKYHLNVENPLEVSHMASYAPDHLADTMMDINLLTPERYEAISQKHNYDSLAIGDELVKILKKSGYDGLRYSNEMEGAGTSYVPFSPTQVKSAIGNRGTYDINDPDLNKAHGGLAMADGGKAGAIKGALNLGRRLLAERPALPAAEREANLAKFLEPSKTPMRLYHGTTATEGGKGTEAIRRIKPSKEGSLGSGVYLTPSPAHASGYSGVPNDEALELMLASPYQQDTALGLLNKRNAGEMLPGQEGGNMLPVYAQVKNPLVIEGTHADPMIEALVKLGVDEDKAVRMVERAYENKGYIGKEVETRARAAGYDGLMQYRNGDLSEVVSYNPNAVKSAIGNEGTYDISVPDLSKAEGGSVFKKIQFMDRGGITTSGGTFSPEELGVTSAELNAPLVSKDRMKQIKANAAELWNEGKEQLEKEYRQLSRPGGKKDFAIRVGSQILGGVPDLINLGLEGVDLVQSAIPGLGKPASVLDTAGTGDRIPKFRLASDEPWLGSQLFMRKFKEAELLGKNEFPLTELAAGFASPAIAAGAIKGGKKAVKAIADAPKKRRGGLTAMTR